MIRFKCALESNLSRTKAAVVLLIIYDTELSGGNSMNTLCRMDEALPIA